VFCLLGSNLANSIEFANDQLLAEGQLVIGQRKSPVPCDTGLPLFGSACWARTSDPMINSHLLYQLS
jgi:hypothetical protein